MSKNRKEDLREEVIKNADVRQEFITDVDGFVYWYPSDGSGSFSSFHLRFIADELDARNQAWNNKIDEHFSGENHGRDN